MTTLILLMLVIPPAAGAVVALVRRGSDRAARAVIAGAAVSTAAAAAGVVAVGREPGGEIAAMGLSLDRPMSLLALVVAATASVVAGFAGRNLDPEPRTVRFFAAVGVLVSASLLALTSAGPVGLAVGWVLSGWALVDMVGHQQGWAPVAKARRRIVVSLAVGDVALISAVLVAAAHGANGAWFGAEMRAELAGATVAGVEATHVVAVLLVVAGLSRSALFPFHRWLEGTLVAPTPVSALVHAGLVSGAGILLIRTHELFLASQPALYSAFAAGVVTILIAGRIAAGRPDAKGSLAWSTVGQMAFMVVQCAVGAFSSAVVHIAGHGMYKAAQFLGAGDTVSATLRAKRSPVARDSVGAAARMVTLVVVPAAAVGLAAWLVTPQLGDAGRLVVVLFAWLSVMQALRGWLDRNPLASAATVAIGTVASFGASFAYFGALNALESFMKPSLAAEASDVGVWAVLAALAIAALSSLMMGRRAGTHAVVSPAPDPSAAIDRAQIRSDVAKAASIISPMWPLSSFVAVNPLTGVEAQGFDSATATARRWLRARTHLSLAQFRQDHQAGLTTLDDLGYAVNQRCVDVCAGPPVELDGSFIGRDEIITTDLLHGPDTPSVEAARTILERAGLSEQADKADTIVADHLARYMTMPTDCADFVSYFATAARADTRLHRLAGAPGRSWLTATLDQGNDPAMLLAAACAAMRIGPEARVDEMRGLLARLNGWAGLAKWRNDWAAPDEERPRLAPIDVVTALALTEAAVAMGMSVDFNTQAEHDLDEDALLDARVAAVAAILAPSRQDANSLEAIREVLSGVSAHERHHIWLMAQEHHFDRHLIAKIDRIDPGPGTTRPAAQAVFCIDVRSEGLRRHVEELGSAAGTPIETIGFAGFFGVPLKVRKLGWDHAEARCPVLVAPTVGFSEHPHVESVDAAAGRLGAARARDAVRAAHSKAKKGQGSAFAMAEAAGWLVGPMAAAKTFVPRKAQAPSSRASQVTPDDGVLVDQKIFAAESVLRTMGLIEGFAPLVLLCGHGSATVNNPHATALDCGACAGASGDDNALAVAGLLNDADVRLALHDRGISIPDDTWFVAGLHDTASDHVSILDKASAPQTHVGQIDQLQALLERAGRANAADRAQHLVGPQHTVRDRGADWAQVRPEWGLARAAAFIIGPRSLTAGVDLEGRAFLHSYDQSNDPTGRVLETIMTAPLVVGHWIGSQYYFSTVDPERFGAGDKLVHNPIGSLGVVSGPGGDLRVGLPLQSTHVAGSRHHQPLRLLAVIQADLELIEQIIAKNKVLQTLIGGSWLRIAARSHPHEPWSLRTAAGTWLSSPSSISAGTLRPGIELEPIVHTRS